MNEQPTVGGSMLDNLRFLVRACQPVQVNISLHPGQVCTFILFPCIFFWVKFSPCVFEICIILFQSQNSLSKSDCSDSTPGSTHTRTRKTTLSSVHPNDYSECPAKLQTVDSSSMCNGMFDCI